MIKKRVKRLENITIDTGMKFCKTHCLKERKKEIRKKIEEIIIKR